MGNVGSAKAPTATQTTSGRAERLQNTVEPQLGQKLKVVVEPLSASRAKMAPAPLTATASPGKIATSPNADPVRLWQLRQLQREITSGSPSQAAVRAPQAQAAVRDVIRYPFSMQARDKPAAP